MDYSGFRRSANMEDNSDVLSRLVTLLTHPLRSQWETRDQGGFTVPGTPLSRAQIAADFPTFPSADPQYKPMAAALGLDSIQAQNTTPPFKPATSFNTSLNPLQELMFRGWLQQNNVPFNPNASGPTDYDMRGYYQGLQNGNPMARPSSVNPNDNLPHFPDYYKTPLHQSFSSESQWAGPNTPQWVNDSQLAGPNGRVVYDEKPSGLGGILAALMGR